MRAMRAVSFYLRQMFEARAESQNSENALTKRGAPLRDDG